VPVLWHLKVSHYNEKARWALDHKRVPHVRRAAVPGRHSAIAERLTGGRTFPVLVLDDRAIGDSTRIIEALERRFPDPPLYPADAIERRRALDIEDFFDEELGPHARLLVLHHLLPNAGLLLGTFAPDLAGPRRMLARVMFPGARRRITAQFGIDRDSVDLAYRKVHAAGRRFARELQPSGYLVGDRFTVADLTVAALAAPVVSVPAAPPRGSVPGRATRRARRLRTGAVGSRDLRPPPRPLVRGHGVTLTSAHGSGPGSPPAATTASRGR
jgi:glutathione S-transferase